MTLSWRFPRVLRSGATRRRIRRLVVDLEHRSGALTQPLRRALGDESLQVALWLPEDERWVDAAGETVDLPQHGDDRAVTRLQGSHGPLAALIHDKGLGRDHRLLEAVAAAARLALENERLEAQLRARIAEVRASRQRVVAAGDAERRRIERDLHDGAQQRLVSLSLGLQMVGMRLGEPPDATANDLLGRGINVAQEAIDELRRIAQGIFPPALAEEGLAAALAGLAVAAPIPVQLEETPQVRAAATVEAAAYFAAVEAIGTAARGAPDAGVRLSARVEGASLEMAVEQPDGNSGDLHSQDLEDRVDAVGGTVTNGPGWLRIQIPTGNEAA